MANLKDLVEATGAVINDWFYSPDNPQYESNLKLVSDAASAMYGNVGANLDNRNWDEILASSNPIQAANDALAVMYSDPAYREENNANLIEAGYKPAQAYWTYNQMNDRVGATYVPTLDEVNAVNKYFDALNLPEEKWNFDGTKVTTNKANSGSASGSGSGSGSNSGSPIPGVTGVNTPSSNSSSVNQISDGNQSVPMVMGPNISNLGGWNARQTFGGNSQLMGAGNANYHSALVKSLRQNSLTPFSNNTGVTFVPNQGFTSVNWTPPAGSGGGAFNPQVLNPRAASEQEVADWNAYNTYRTNSLNAKTPILSFSEWLADGKVDGTKQEPNTTAPGPTVDYSGGGG